MNAAIRGRTLLIVLDGLGVGALDDDPAGPNTLSHAASAIGRAPRIPYLSSLGLLDTFSARQVGRPGLGRLRQSTAFNESYSAHWEFAGHVATSGVAFDNGVPAEWLSVLELAAGRPLIGNLPLYPHVHRIPREIVKESANRKFPILLTHAGTDAIGTIAVYASESWMPRSRLHAIADAAADGLRTTGAVGRVCVRSLTDEGDVIESSRKDVPFFSIVPPLFPRLLGGGLEVALLGKVGRLFGDPDVTYRSDRWGDSAIYEDTLDAIRTVEQGLIWTNFNSLNRPAAASRDVRRWIEVLEEYDVLIARLAAHMGKDDVVMIVGDHGRDPTGDGSQTQEWCPLLVRSERHLNMGWLGSRLHLDVAASILDIWGLQPLPVGASFFRRR